MPVKFDNRWHIFGVRGEYLVQTKDKKETKGPYKTRIQAQEALYMLAKLDSEREERERTA